MNRWHIDAVRSTYYTVCGSENSQCLTFSRKLTLCLPLLCHQFVCFSSSILSRFVRHGCCSCPACSPRVIPKCGLPQHGVFHFCIIFLVFIVRFVASPSFSFLYQLSRNKACFLFPSTSVLVSLVLGPLLLYYYNWNASTVSSVAMHCYALRVAHITV